MQASVRPPFIPGCLVRLFVCGQNAEAIVGDLAEEFGGLVSTAGFGPARRWYWRQSAKTVANLIVATFRTAPWMMAATIVGGFLLLGFAMRIVWIDSLPSLFLPERVAFIAVVGWHRRGAMVSLDYAWLIDSVGLAGRLIVATFVGFIVALVAKRKEMIATGALCFLCEILCLVQLPLWFAKFASTHAYPPLWFAAVSNFMYPPALVLGGMIVWFARSRATQSSPKVLE